MKWFICLFVGFFLVLVTFRGENLFLFLPYFQRLKFSHRLRCAVQIYIYIYNLIRWATFGLQKVMKQRERWKTKAIQGRDEKEDKILKSEKNPTPSVGVFLGHFLLYNWGNRIFWFFFCPLIEVMAVYIYTYTYIIIYLLNNDTTSSNIKYGIGNDRGTTRITAWH